MKVLSIEFLPYICLKYLADRFSGLGALIQNPSKLFPSVDAVLNVELPSNHFHYEHESRRYTVSESYISVSISKWNDIHFR